LSWCLKRLDNTLFSCLSFSAILGGIKPKKRGVTVHSKASTVSMKSEGFFDANNVIVYIQYTVFKPVL